MKAILISIRPQHTCNILNDIKWWEIRKKFPKDYVGWVYIYCCKDKSYPLVIGSDGFGTEEYCNGKHYPPFIVSDILNGKVVARFWCDKVERLYEYQIDGYGSEYEIASDTLKQEELLKECCLTYDQLSDYLGDINNGYAIHITKLEIFDEPKEISEFMIHNIKKHHVFDNFRLTRAPQSYCFIEI